MGGVVTLAAMLAAPIATTIWIAGARDVAPVTPGVSLATSADVRSAATLGSAPAPTVIASPSRTLPLTGVVLAIWMVGVVVLSIRLLGGWLTARRVAQRQRRPATVEIQAMAARLAERLALRRFVDVVESAGVAVPIGGRLAQVR